MWKFHYSFFKLRNGTQKSKSIYWTIPKDTVWLFLKYDLKLTYLTNISLLAESCSACTSYCTSHFKICAIFWRSGSTSYSDLEKKTIFYTENNYIQISQLISLTNTADTKTRCTCSSIGTTLVWTLFSAQKSFHFIQKLHQKL